MPRAAKTTYDALDAAGGVNGCKIDYVIADDKADPQAAAQAARDLIDNKGIVAMSGGTQEAYKAALGRWETLTGQKMKLVDLTAPITGDYTPFIIKARDAGCDAVVSNAIEPGVVAWVNTAEAHKITGINWLFLSPGYAVQVAKALADTKQPIFVGAEWEPYTEQNSPANKDWIAAMKASNRPLTAFSPGGYPAAMATLDVIKSIDGPVTRESMNKALAKMKPDVNPIAGSPYVFGTGPRHAPMRATNRRVSRHRAVRRHPRRVIVVAERSPLG